MARFSLFQFRFAVSLPQGNVIVRIYCPGCRHLHPDIEEGEERVCQGCGHLLTVSGLELQASDYPEGWYDREDPDYPGYTWDAE